MSDTDTPSWGIEPVPERLRVLGAFDGFLLWANLSVSLLVIVAGAFLVLPASEFGLALSLPEATEPEDVEPAEPVEVEEPETAEV